MGTMALTRAAFLPLYLFRASRPLGHPLAALILLTLSGCAAGVEEGGFEPDLGITDATATVPPSTPPVVEAGIILPPFDAGLPPVVPDLPRDAAAPPRDTGTSAPQDSGSQTPLDSGSQTPLDSGSQTPLDSGSQTPRDTGTPPPVDSGGGTATNMCAAAPAYSTASECGKCTCMRCATQVTSCVASADSAKNTVCATVRSCAEKNSCTGSGCYCGSSLLCLNPDGPCRQEIETAAASTDVAVIQEASMNAESPVGRSVAVGECQLQNCRQECGLP
jgi:hypothetical protein